MHRNLLRDPRRSRSRPTVEPLEGRALLAAMLSVTASDASIAGRIAQAVLTSYTVTNTGTTAATDVKLGVTARNEARLDPVQARSSQQIALVGGVTQGAVSSNFPTVNVEADFGTLAAGRSATVTLSVSLVRPGADFHVASPTAEGVPDSGRPSATTTVTAIGNADRVVTASPTTRARAGVPETFTFQVGYASGSRVPPDTLFALDFTSTGGPAATGVATSVGTVAALSAYPDGYGGDLGMILPGQVATVSATIIPPASGTVAATLFAYSPYEVETVPGNNLAFAASAVASASAPSVLGATLLPTAGPIAAVSVDFDAPLDVARALDVRNYVLMTTGSHARAAIGSAGYDAATRVVTLRLSRPLPRQGPALQLVVAGVGSPGLTGADGSRLLNAGVTLSLPRT